MDLLSRQEGDATIVTLQVSRIDAASAIQFKDAMRELATRTSGRVILDMSQVTFLDSSGLGAVVAVMKLLGPGRQLELAGLTSQVDKVFRLTRMDSVFVIHPKPSDAATVDQRDAG